MDLNSNGFAKFLQNIIKEMINIEIEKYLKNNNIVAAWVGTVDSVDAGANTADILLPTQSVAITKQNKTNQTLAENDEVYLISPSGRLSNSFVGFKKDEYLGANSGFTQDGGLYISLINKTGAVSVKGTVVDANSALANSVKKILQDIPDAIGVIYEDGIADGSYVKVIVSGIADVYFIGNTTIGHLARTFVAGDGDFVTGQAKSEAVPSTPFVSDEHFCEIGHVIEARTGAGLAKTVLHFN